MGLTLTRQYKHGNRQESEWIADVDKVDDLTQHLNHMSPYFFYFIKDNWKDTVTPVDPVYYVKGDF